MSTPSTSNSNANKPIVIAHLSNGQTVVARLDERPVPQDPSQADDLPGETEVGSTWLLDPMTIFTAPGPGGRLQVSLVPFGNLFGALPAITEFQLQWWHLMVPMFDAPEAMVTQYLQATSKIAIVPANSHLSLGQP